MPPPTNVKTVKSFMGKVSYLRRFIPALAEQMEPLQTLLKKGREFQWTQSHQKAFEGIKEALASPRTMIPPEKGKPLLLYLTSTAKAIGALLAQEAEGVERPVYYLSRLLQGPELNYSAMEKHCLALSYACAKFRHYLLAHKVSLVTKADPLRYMLHRPALSGRLARWLMGLSEFDITTQAPKALKSQALADLLAYFPSGTHEPLGEELPGEEVHLAEQGEWLLEFDGSAISQGGRKTGGAGIVITAPSGCKASLAFKLDFPCTNNEAEYEALVIGLMMIKDMGAAEVLIRGDSRLVMKQVEGEFAVKEAALARYRELVQQLTKNLNIRLEHCARARNRHADSLATISSKIQMEGEEKVIRVERRSTPCTEMEATVAEEDDWRTEIQKQLRCPGAALKTVKDYVVLRGRLYFRGPNGVLARCISNHEAEERLRDAHQKYCGKEGPKLYRTMQRLGFFWPTMKRDAQSVEEKCARCRGAREHEVHLIEGDWRRQYKEYLLSGTLPGNKDDATKVKITAHKFLFSQGELFKLHHGGKALRCLDAEEGQKVLQELHEGECGAHQGGRRLYQQAVTMGYYWPGMENDAEKFAKTCEKCQRKGDRIHAPAVDLHVVTAPWPFHTWSMDLIGPVTPNSKGHIWILLATERTTKWVEGVTLRKASGAAVASFIKENIICRFGIPRRIITDNGTPFVNSHVSHLTKMYDIRHLKSTPYYPKGNGQAEASNKRLLKILSKMVDDEGRQWKEHLPTALWAFRTSLHSATGATPFSLVYGEEAVIPAEIAVDSARTINRAIPEDSRSTALNGIEGARAKAQEKMKAYHDAMIRAYNKTVRPRKFKLGDWVLRTTQEVRAGLPKGKFSNTWEGPYQIEECHASGYYRLKDTANGDITGPINAKFLKLYHSRL